MGQYYSPILISDDKQQLKTINTHDYGCGLKLTEHSYIGNQVLNVVMNDLVDNPQHLYWLGDYAEFEDLEDNRDNNITEEQFKVLCDEAWADGDKGVRFKDGNINDCHYRYIVNHTKKEYIDMCSYREDWTHWHQWIDRNTGECEIYPETVHPLSLLTSVGNGKGGGDYCNEYPNFELCGTWAGDLIEVSNTKPDGYEEFVDGFEEVAEDE